MTTEMPDKYITLLWNEWMEKAKDCQMPERWSWSCVWESYSGIRNLPSISLEEKFGLKDILTCQFCSQVLEIPYTLQCGCSSCNTCCTINSEDVTVGHTCVVCSKEAYLSPKSLKVNVVLSSFLNKWFTDFSKALKLGKNGHEAFKKRDLDTAIKYFDEAVKLCKYRPTVYHPL